MQYFDVFNGDADGICALHQMRLANPVDSTLITGVKRDISLLKKVEASKGDQVLVLDISLDKNRDDLHRLLEQGAEIQYFDHHFAGDIPSAPNLSTSINTDPNACTSLLVNEFLKQSTCPGQSPLPLVITCINQLELLLSPWRSTMRSWTNWNCWAPALTIMVTALHWMT